MTAMEPSSMRYSNCVHGALSSRTCNNGEVCSFKLFGVKIDPNADPSPRKEKEEDDDHDHHLVNVAGNLVRKCKNMECLEAFNNDSSSMDRECLWDDTPPDRSHNTRNKKKGVSWSEDEHRSFLIGLEELGKGDWRGVSKKYVPSRTPTQVASHAQKYFNRMKATRDRRKRRSSLFDMPFNESLTAPKAPDTTVVRLPVSPTALANGVRDFCYMPHKMSHPSSSRNKHISIDRKRSPRITFIPVVSYPDPQDCVYPFDSRWTAHLATRARLVSWPWAITDQGSSQAGACSFSE